jgi:type III secretion protein T
MAPELPFTQVSELLQLAQPLIATFPRVGTAVLVLPLMPAKLVPRRVKSAFVIALCLVAYPLMAQHMPTADWSWGRWLGYALKESLVGGLIGYAMGVIMWAMTTLGEMIDVQAGFNNAQIFDPFGGGTNPSGPVAAFMSQFGILLFVSVGGFQVFLQLLYESLLLWPPSSFYPTVGAGLKDLAISTSGSVLELATRLAAPVIGVLLIVEIGVGLLNRVAPQLNSFYFSMPIKAAAAVLMLALVISHFADVVHSQYVQAQTLLPTVEKSLKGP